MLYANGHYSFEEFVDATNRARSIDHLCEIMVEAAAHLGFDRINFSVIRDRSLPPANLGFGKISTYTEEWRAHYASYDLQKIDPVVRFASARFGPFRWRDIERQGGLSRRQIAFFRDGEEAALHNGVGLPFSGNDDVIGGIALATSFRGTMHLRIRERRVALASHLCVQKGLVMSVTLDPLRSYQQDMGAMIATMAALPQPIVGGRAAALGTLTSMLRRIDKLVTDLEQRAATEVDRKDLTRDVNTLRWLAETDWVVTDFVGVAFDLSAGTGPQSFAQAIETLSREASSAMA